jgi:multiple antibiotic resistance protein
MDFSILTRTFIAVFVLADALGNAPIVVALTQEMEVEQRNQVVDRASLIATLVLLAFALAGQPILNYMHISIGSLQVAGGIVLLLIALEMLNGDIGTPTLDQPARDVAITPLALPLLAGPGTLSTVMLMVTESPDAKWSVVTGIVGAMVASWIIVRQASWFDKFLGKEGSVIFIKLLGFLLAALAVQIGSDGIHALFS